MANMSYCRFENTARHLEDCADALTEPCSSTEHEYRNALVETCIRIIEELGGKLRDDGAVLVAADELPKDIKE